MLKKAKKILKNNSGFTILELIVVIAIMGFLVALVAPRLSSVGKDSKQTISDTNQQRIKDAVSRKIGKDNSLPDNLTNLVPIDNADMKVDGGFGFLVADIKAGVMVGSTGEDNPWIGSEGNPAEFSREFIEKNNLFVHHLNRDEVNELKSMGITHLVNYRTGKLEPIFGTGEDDNVTIPNKTIKSFGTPVLMVGTGRKNEKENYTGNSYRVGLGKLAAGKVKVDEKFSDPDLIYRIVLGIGEESGLVKDGFIKSTGVIQSGNQKDYIKYNEYYSIVLPRLKSTLIDYVYNNTNTSSGIHDIRSSSSPVLYPKVIKAEGYDSDTASGSPIDEKEFNIGEPQGISSYDIIDSDGTIIKSNSKTKTWKITEIIK